MNAVKPTKDDKPRHKDKVFVNAHAAHGQKDAVQAVNLFDDRQGRTKGGKDKTVIANKTCPACGAHEHTAASCGIFKKLVD